jgi:hypothetical protein
MEKTTNNTYPANIAELIDQMETGRYKHLQIFLRHNTIQSWGWTWTEISDANRDDFGVYTVMSVDYGNGNIQLVLTNADHW